jgi:hypothetical protein
MTQIVYDFRGSNFGKKEVFTFKRNQIRDHLPHLRVLRSIKTNRMQMTRIVYDFRGSNCSNKEALTFTKNQICDHLPHLRVLHSITRIKFLCVLRETRCGPEGPCG